jgi:hypothetical protein
MSTDNLSVVQGIYAAFRDRDFPAVFALVDPEVEMVQTDLLPWGGVHRGHAGLQEFFGKLAAHIESSPQIKHFIVAGDNVVAVGELPGRVKANGKEFHLNIAHVWTVKHGLATRMEAYIDTPTMLAALEG